MRYNFPMPAKARRGKGPRGKRELKLIRKEQQALNTRKAVRRDNGLKENPNPIRTGQYL